MKQIRVLAILATVVGIGALVALEMARPAPGAVSALEPDPNLELLSITPFAFTDLDGETVTEASLDGRLTVMDFFFTNCPFVCPPMGANMARAQEALEGTGVRFVSISVDPARDTPEAMRAYAAKHGGELDTWSFLRSEDLAQQNRMLQEGLLLPALSVDESREIDLPDGSTMSNIAHPSVFLLIGPDRRILTIAQGTVAADVDRLIARARAASAAMAD
ncbi:MAG: SCO family protein [Phycisphaerales bacterium]